MIIDVNMHHLPENLFDDEKVLDGFLSTAPRGYGEIAYMGETAKGQRQIIVEKPKGYQELRRGRLQPGDEDPGHGRRRRGHRRSARARVAGVAASGHL